MTTAQSPPTRATWRAWVGLVLLTIPVFMMATDMTVLFLAMPSIAADLAPSTTQMLWIMHVGEFVAAGLVITMGRLTDEVGRRRLLMLAMLLYGASSALAAFSPSPELLIVARVLIGVATAAASPAGIALLRSMFPDPAQFGVAFAVFMGGFSAGGALGPPIGGLLLEYFSWGSVFLVNVPVAALLLLAGPALLPTHRSARGGAVDIRSVGLSMTAVIMVVFGLQEIADDGFSAAYLAAIVVGLGLGVVFVRRQTRLSEPLLDLTLFRSRGLRNATIALVVTSLAFVAVDLVLVQYLQIVEQVPMARLGVLLTVPGVAAVVGTLLTPAASRFARPSHVMAGGLTIAAGGTAMVPLGIEFATDPVAWLIGGSTLISLGITPLMVLGAQLIVGGVPPSKAGPAAAIQDVGAGFGAAMGTAVMGSMVMALFGVLTRAGAPDDVTAAEVDAATQSPGGAMAVATGITGTTGQEFLATVQASWSTSTQAAYGVALLIGVATIVLVLRGLRGETLTTRDETDGSAPDAGPTDDGDDVEKHENTGDRGLVCAAEHESTDDVGGTDTRRSAPDMVDGQATETASRSTSPC